MAARTAKPKPDPLVRRDGDGRLYAVVDLVVERADLGPTAGTLVAAGDPVPADLRDLPRSPRV
jgi:hypothetical protein